MRTVWGNTSDALSCYNIMSTVGSAQGVTHSHSLQPTCLTVVASIPGKAFARVRGGLSVDAAAVIEART